LFNNNITLKTSQTSYIFYRDILLLMFLFSRNYELRLPFRRRFWSYNWVQLSAHMKTTTRSVIGSDVIKNKLKPVNNTMTVVQTRLRVDTWMWLHEHRVWRRTLDNNRRRRLCRSVGLALLLWSSSSWQLAVLMGHADSQLKSWFSVV